jgi:hypothetical protein
MHRRAERRLAAGGLLLFAVVPAWKRAGTTAQERQPVPPPAAATRVNPFLETALAELALEQVRLNRLAMRAGDGDHDALQQLYAEVLDQLPKSVLTEFDEQHGISTRTVYEMALTWKANEVLRRAVETAGAPGKKEGALGPDDLLEVLRRPDLGRLPESGVPRAVRDFVAEVTARTSPDVTVQIWYPATAWLVFAALHGGGLEKARERWWPDDDAGRARRSEFVRSLLELVAAADDAKTASIVTRIVDVALASPLDVPHEKGLVTCCRAEFARHRGRVGFDPSHLEFASRFGSEAQRDAASGATRLDGVRLDPFMPAPADRAAFMAVMRLRILLELDPGGFAGPAALRFGTPAEVEAYYRAIFAERGWRNAWAEARGDVRQMVAGTFPDLRDAQIDALRVRASDPTLSEEERERAAEELRELEHARARDHERVAGVILRLLAEEGDVELVKDELLALHPKGAAAIYGDWNATFVAPWIMIVKRDAGWVDGLLEDSLKQRRDVPKPALEAALLEVRERLRREVRAQDVETLVAIGCDGPADVRGVAFYDQMAMPAEAARRLYDVALFDAARADKSARAEAGRRLFRPMVELLYDRRAEAWTSEALLDTFNHEGASLWRGAYLPDVQPIGPGAAQQVAREKALLEWLATSLDDATFAKLEREGRIPARIRDERERLRTTPSGR